jgi:hypothetical protein
MGEVTGIAKPRHTVRGVAIGVSIGLAWGVFWAVVWGGWPTHLLH